MLPFELRPWRGRAPAEGAPGPVPALTLRVPDFQPGKLGQRTDEMGSFDFPGLGPGGHYRSKFRARFLQPATKEIILLRARHAIELKLE